MSGRAVLTLLLAACCAHALAADAPAPHPPASASAAGSAATAPAAGPDAPAIPATAPPPLSSKPAAETPATTTAPMAPREPIVAAMPPAPVGSAAGAPSDVNLLQTIFGLVVVLALLAGLAWFLKRFGPRNATGSADLRIVGALNLGGRERIVVVEVGDQWIVVGASPGRVNALAQLPRQQQAEHSAPVVPGAYAPSANSFSDWLKQTIDKRK